MSNGGPSGDKWAYVAIGDNESPDEILAVLNQDPAHPITAAFVAELRETLYLFYGIYPGDNQQ